jgi:hypothetical protein
MYFGKRIVYTDTHTRVIIRENEHTSAARITKYNTATTLTFPGLRTVTCTSPPDFLIEGNWKNRMVGGKCAWGEEIGERKG